MKLIEITTTRSQNMRASLRQFVPDCIEGSSVMSRDFAECRVNYPA